MKIDYLKFISKNECKSNKFNNVATTCLSEGAKKKWSCYWLVFLGVV